MARVFTIAPGLENMGGLKTGGQGSIYKGRRIGEIITAIKILPTPILNESSADNNYVTFQNEVEKLKKVNEVPNPNVVKILSSGISSSGSFPFIEMEYIEGHDLEEILQSPDHPVFTINETLKVAEQLSHAIGHCHKLDVRHGDIKSNNVKFNSETGNYVLLDFGLAVMSDEQRRNNLSLGSIEFMAPEQNTGQMLFQTDVYSFGIVLFELLTGRVPFPLKGNGETARNEVRLAHMASPVPNVIELRRSALPTNWDAEKRQREMRVPEWLLTVINKCLEKKPERRFANGIELHKYIIQQFISRPDQATVRVNQFSVRPLQKEDFIVNHEQLKKQISQYRQELARKESELAKLKELLKQKEAALPTVKNKTVERIRPIEKTGRVSRTSFTALLFLTIALGAFAMFPIFKNKFSANTEKAPNLRTRTSSKGVDAGRSQTGNADEDSRIEQSQQPNTVTQGTVTANDTIQHPPGDEPNEQANNTAKAGEETVEENATEQSNGNDEDASKPVAHPDENDNQAKKAETPNNETADNADGGKNGVSKKYLVVSKAYFYNEADENTKRNEFISPLEKAVVQGLNERYGFIYVVITNPRGQVFKGWLRKSDLKLYSID